MKIKKRYLPVTIICVVAVLMLWLTGFSYLFNPQSWGMPALLGYAFPAALVAVIATIVLCAFVRKRLLIIPIVGLLVAYQPVTLYCPLNTSTSTPDDAIQLLSFNTAWWGRFVDGSADGKGEDGETNKVVQYILDCDADIVCLQESNISDPVHTDLDSLINPVYHYRDTIVRNNNAMTVYSKFPITHSEQVKYESSANYTKALTLNVRGKKVILLSSHLQTMGIPIKDRQLFSDMMHGEMEKDTMKTTSRTILGYLTDATKRRAPQADAIASYLRMHEGTPVICCGDFNDIPQSYVHHTIQHATDEPLTDCYQATGFGPGYTYGRFAMRVRIDNIMCSSNITPYNCTVDNTIDVSDHYPIRCWFTIP